MRECYRFSAKTALTGSVIAGLALGIFAPQVIQLFTESDPGYDVHWLSLYSPAVCGSSDPCVGSCRQYVLRGPWVCAWRNADRDVPPGQLLLPGAVPAGSLLRRNCVAATQAVADALCIVIIIPILRKVMRMVNEAEAEYRMQQKG